MKTRNMSKFYRSTLIILFMSPIIIIMVTVGALTGHAAPLPNQGYQTELTPQWPATPTADAFEFPPAIAPQTSIQADGDGNFFTIYLPMIFKSIFQEPLLTAYGPVVDPSQPDSVSGQATIVPIVTDPGTPSTPSPIPPTPGGSPTPGPGTPTWTPTSKPTLTPTIMPTATEELVPGGGLEEEDQRGDWFEYSWRDFDLFFDDSNGIPQAPGGAFDGDWYMWLGGLVDEVSYVERQFTFPDPNKNQYKRYYLGHAINLQSYDSVCATSKYASMPIVDRDVMLAGLLRHAMTPTLVNQFGVDLGGMIMCVNKTGKSGCNPDNVEDLGGGRKAVYVAYYDLCELGSGTGWLLFLFPIATESGGPNLAGKNVTVQIKAISDRELSSSVLVDYVTYWHGPPLPTPTPRTLSLDTAPQTQDNIVVMNPILVPDLPPVPPGVQFIYPDKKDTLISLDTNSNWTK